MFITKITIKNFKAFKEEVTVDLNPNPNGINNDLNLSRIKKIDDKYLLPIVSIGGMNAIGKTSILKSIRTLSYFFVNDGSSIDSSFISTIIDIKYQEMYRFTNWVQNIIRNVKFKYPNSLATIIDEDSLDLVVENFFAVFKEQKQYFTKQKIADFFRKIIFDWDETRVRKWFLKKHDSNTETSIKLFFYDKKYGEFSVEINDRLGIIKNNLNSIKPAEINISYSQKDGKDLFLEESFYPDFVNYWRNVHLLIIKDSDNLNLKQCVELINKLGMKKFIHLLNVADPNIKRLITISNVDKKIVGVSGFVNYDGSSTIIENLSRGTKAFLKIMYVFIVLLPRNDSGLVLIDEIETFMHYKLVDFFKQYMNANFDKQWQLIYTSHNPLVLTSLLSNKQIFFIDYDEKKHRVIKKVSSLIKNSNSSLKSFIEQRIGSAPDETLINDVLYNDLI